MNKFRGECQVTISGKSRGMVFNTYAFFLLCEKLKCDLADMGKILGGKSPIRAITVLIWCAVESYCDENGEVNDLKVSDVADALLTMSKEDSEKINEAIKIAMESVDAAAKVSDKKK